MVPIHAPYSIASPMTTMRSTGDETSGSGVCSSSGITTASGGDVPPISTSSSLSSSSEDKAPSPPSTEVSMKAPGGIFEGSRCGTGGGPPGGANVAEEPESHSRDVDMNAIRDK